MHFFFKKVALRSYYKLKKKKIEIINKIIKSIERLIVLSFNQAPWLKEYIDFKTQKRSAAVNVFDNKTSTSC